MSKIKNTKELLTAVAMLAAEIGAASRDGFQFADLPTVISNITSNPEKKAQYEAALKDVKEVSAEFKQMGWMEGLELATHLANLVPQIVKSFDKKQALLAAQTQTAQPLVNGEPAPVSHAVENQAKV